MKIRNWIILGIVFLILIVSYYFLIYKGAYCVMHRSIEIWPQKSDGCYKNLVSKIISKPNLGLNDCKRIMGFYLESKADNYRLYFSCINQLAIVKSDLAFCLLLDEKFTTEAYSYKLSLPRLPQECVMNYAKAKKDPVACFFHNVFSGDGDPTNFNVCYKEAGGNLTSEVCSRLIDSWEKSCCEKRAKGDMGGC